MGLFGTIGKIIPAVAVLVDKITSAVRGKRKPASGGHRDIEDTRDEIEARRAARDERMRGKHGGGD